MNRRPLVAILLVATGLLCALRECSLPPAPPAVGESDSRVGRAAPVTTSEPIAPASRAEREEVVGTPSTVWQFEAQLCQGGVPYAVSAPFYLRLVDESDTVLVESRVVTDHRGRAATYLHAHPYATKCLVADDESDDWLVLPGEVTRDLFSGTVCAIECRALACWVEGQVVAPESSACRVLYVRGWHQPDCDVDFAGRFRFKAAIWSNAVCLDYGAREPLPVNARSVIQLAEGQHEIRELRLVLPERLRTLTIQCDHESVPISGVRCLVDGRFVGESDDRGRVACLIEHGKPCLLRAVASGYAESVHHIDSDSTSVNVRLTRSRVVTGTIVDEAGAGVADAVIYGRTRDGAVHYQRSGPDGAFRLDLGAPDEPVLLAAEAGEKWAELVLGPSAASTGLTLPLRRGASFAGAVVAETGEPVAGATVRLPRVDRAQLYTWIGRTTATGVYRGSVTLDGTHSLQVSHPDFVWHEGDLQELVVLRRHGYVHGRIAAWDGHPYRVAVLDPADGGVLVTGMHAGQSFTLAVRERTVGSTVTVEITSGAKRCRIEGYPLLRSDHVPREFVLSEGGR